jgi:hypothetical protein
MAREAGFMYPVSTDGYMGLAYDYRVGKETGGSLKTFEALVRADEREACAKVADLAEPYQAADLIRARGNNDGRSI